MFSTLFSSVLPASLCQAALSLVAAPAPAVRRRRGPSDHLRLDRLLQSGSLRCERASRRQDCLSVFATGLTLDRPTHADEDDTLASDGCTVELTGYGHDVSLASGTALISDVPAVHIVRFDQRLHLRGQNPHWLRTLLLVEAPTSAMHAEIVARLSKALRNDRLCELLSLGASKETLLEALATYEDEQAANAK